MIYCISMDTVPFHKTIVRYHRCKLAHEEIVK
jgi:hypothetical protein